MILMIPMVYWFMLKVERKQDAGVDIEGGIGVGRVTKPGLACAVGGPAINPTPRKMITTEVTNVMKKYNYDGGLKATISIPQGGNCQENFQSPV